MIIVMKQTIEDSFQFMGKDESGDRKLMYSVCKFYKGVSYNHDPDERMGEADWNERCDKFKKMGHAE